MKPEKPLPPYRPDPAVKRKENRALIGVLLVVFVAAVAVPVLFLWFILHSCKIV